MKNLQKIFFLAILFFSVFGMAKSSQAAVTYYVSLSGSDSNNGLISTPFKTIKKAADIVNPGDTVYVRAGTYNERIVLTRSGTASNYITFQPYPGETVYLDGTGLGNGVMFRGYNVSYIKVIGLKIRNYVGAGIHFRPSVSNGFGGSHIEIKDNEIYNGTFLLDYGHAILVVTWPWGSTNAYTDVIVDGNYIHDVVTGMDSAYNEALTLAGLITRFQITNNIIDNAQYIGMDLIGRGAQFPSNGIVMNNEVKNSCSLANTSAIYIDGAKNVLIEGNKVHNNGGNGIDVSAEQAGFVTENVIVRKNEAWNNIRNILIGSSSDGTARYLRFVHNTASITAIGKSSNYPLFKTDYNIVKNNISYNTITDGYHLKNSYGAITNTTLNYNNYYLPNLWFHYASIFYANFSAYQSGTGQDTNSLAYDPKFINLYGNDFSLQSDSPCIDAGDFLTRTTSSGSGTSLVVEDARYFTDGYGVIQGDLVQVGSNNPVRITSINYNTNTITLEKNISWNKGDGVSYSYSGSAPDIGAYEYVGGSTDATPPAAPGGLTVQ